MHWSNTRQNRAQERTSGTEKTLMMRDYAHSTRVPGAEQDRGLCPPLRVKSGASAVPELRLQLPLFLHVSSCLIPASSPLPPSSSPLLSSFSFPLLTLPTGSTLRARRRRHAVPHPPRCLPRVHGVHRKRVRDAFLYRHDPPPRFSSSEPGGKRCSRTSHRCWR